MTIIDKTKRDLFMCYYLIFTGQMEYARLIIISSPVGDLFQSWLFHGK
jgi:hypothetical protein